MGRRQPQPRGEYQDQRHEQERQEDGQDAVPRAYGAGVARRRDGIGGQPDHQPVDEDPKGCVAQVLRTERQGLAQRAGDSEQHEDLERGELPSPEHEGPGDEQRREHDHAVIQHHVEVVGRSGDIGFTDGDPEPGRAVGHGGRDGLLGEGQ